MKVKTILFTSLLVISLVLSGCGSEKPTETTINLPAVSGGEAQTTAMPTTIATEVQNPEVIYPVSETSEPITDIALSYPIDDSSPNYDAEMRAFIEQILNGTMPIEDLFGKDDDVTQDILLEAAQGRIILSDTALKQAADWLEKQ